MQDGKTKKNELISFLFSVICIFKCHGFSTDYKTMWPDFYLQRQSDQTNNTYFVMPVTHTE